MHANAEPDSSNCTLIPFLKNVEIIGKELLRVFFNSFQQTLIKTTQSVFTFSLKNYSNVNPDYVHVCTLTKELKEEND